MLKSLRTNSIDLCTSNVWALLYPLRMLQCNINPSIFFLLFQPLTCRSLV